MLFMLGDFPATLVSVWLVRLLVVIPVADCWRVTAQSVASVCHWVDGWHINLFVWSCLLVTLPCWKVLTCFSQSCRVCLSVFCVDDWRTHMLVWLSRLLTLIAHDSLCGVANADVCLHTWVACTWPASTFLNRAYFWFLIFVSRTFVCRACRLTWRDVVYCACCLTWRDACHVPCLAWLLTFDCCFGIFRDIQFPFSLTSDFCFWMPGAAVHRQGNVFLCCGQLEFRLGMLNQKVHM